MNKVADHIIPGPIEHEHKASSDCWCHPEPDYVDPITGEVLVWVHLKEQ